MRVNTINIFIINNIEDRKVNVSNNSFSKYVTLKNMLVPIERTKFNNNFLHRKEIKEEEEIYLVTELI